MIPSALCSQLQQGLGDFLRMSFWSSTPGMEGVIDRLIETQGAILKGPYVSLKLPFLPGAEGEYFSKVPLGFPAHLHQERAFRRLSGNSPESTIVATGTGSGKTESFLWPILEHCRQNLGTPGIKAILIYPMNALATDQAGRIARAIHENRFLRGDGSQDGVRAGLYIGESTGEKRKTHKGMGPDHIITDRKSMQDNPPDILLTNYKMLDYLLVRPKDQELWKQNIGGPLQYLVVDELHTFDGAQGTDLACLIRRLKDRLAVEANSLCCVGTSATLGGADSVAALRDYAKDIFGESFGNDSVIAEERQSPADFTSGRMIEVAAIVSAQQAQLDPAQYATPGEYLEAQQALWFHAEDGGGRIEAAAGTDEWRVELGEQLLKHIVLRNILTLLEKGPVVLPELVESLSRASKELRDDAELARFVVISFLSLIAEARSWQTENQEARERREERGDALRTRPFLEVRLQLWQREMRRMVGDVGPKPTLRFNDDLTDEQRRQHLPVIHCRDCGAMGWAALVSRDRPDRYRTNLDKFYRAFFSEDPQVRFLWPAVATPDFGEWNEEQSFPLHRETLERIRDEDVAPDLTCKVSISENLRQKQGKQVHHKDCPFCGARGSLTLLGFRGATLTSVYIDQLFASTFNDDKKLLTFSDSVQDAAHRAGFFGARTWHFNLRVALQQVVAGQDDLLLEELPDAFAEYWLSPDRLDDVMFASSFVAPNMEWLREYEALKDTGEVDKAGTLLSDIKRRIAYEVFMEYGHKARIGRSLPRTGSSTAYLSPSRLDDGLPVLLERLQNEVGGLKALDEVTLRAFLLGAMHHLRERGGILHRELPGNFIQTLGKDTDSFKRGEGKRFLPDFGRRSRMPGLLTEAPGYQQFDPLLLKGGAGSWYQRWVDRCMGIEESGGLVIASNVWEVVLPELVRHDILERRDGTTGKLWGLRPNVLNVSAKTERLRCLVCNHWIVIAEAEADGWTSMPCLTARCAGTYGVDASRPDSYFGKLYGTGQVKRVVTAEHTGLLKRGEREVTEAEFKSEEGERKPWFANLLSCTPTLEMGIDIGSLSTAILCSVPPTQASYLQRVGRAGRRDGNSMLLTIAAAKPHDQYFFAKPELMLDGDVATPGVFLNASAVLERQLTAFCLDRWIAKLEDKDAIPAKLGKVFEQLDDAGNGRFPHSWLDFVEGRQEEILQRFFGLFEEGISDDTRAHLRHYLIGSEETEGSLLRWKVGDLLQGERKQRNSLRSNALKAKKAIDELAATNAKNKDHEDELRKMRDEKDALGRLVRQIENAQTLQFLTDQGLLPNYAFPESPIRLRSVIWRQKQRKPEQQEGDAKKSSKGRYEIKTFDYVRPAASALSELAPENRFFAGGRHVQIDQVDVGSAEIETWRFCSQCAYSLAIDGGDIHKDCPRCHNPVWGEEDQKRQLLKLNQVFASESDRDSRIRDDREGRQPKYYNQHMLMDFDPSDRGGAWRLNTEALPFAFEYLRRATFREINFGESADTGATKFSIAGREEIRKGFLICRHCGKVQDMGTSKKKDSTPAKPEHALWCSARKQGPEQKDFQAAVYLYREFSSEAIRLLLPLSEIGSTQQLNSFVAAFQLGLRDKYGGRVDHLNTLVYSEPEKDGFLRRQYLVLYDTVPGGTGYLKDFTQEAADGGQHPLFDILKRSVSRLMNCECFSDPERDGCYACLFGYRNSREMAETSSQSAAELFSRILDEEDSLEKVDALSDVTIHGLLDSILEARFLDALHRICGTRRDVRVEKSTVRSKPGYRVTVDGVSWLVEPQVELRPEDGIDPTVSIDFVFRPSSSKDQRKPIAVFLDGYEFHEKRIGLDMLQRMTLVSSGSYEVFSFDWFDVDIAFHKDSEEAPFLLHQERATLTNAMNKLGQAAANSVFDKPMLEVFLDSLVSPETVPWEKISTIAVYAQLNPPGKVQLAGWKEELTARVPHEVGQWLDQVDETWLLAQRAPTSKSPLGLWAAVPPAAVSDMSRVEDYRVVVWLDDSLERREDPNFRKTWRGWLHLFQYLSALPNAWFLTASGGATLPYQPLIATRFAAGPSDDVGPWEPLALEVEPNFKSLVETLSVQGLPLPVVGLDLPDSKGHSCGLEGEIVWPEFKIAVVEDIESSERPISTDWQVFELSSLSSDVTPLCTAVQNAQGAN